MRTLICILTLWTVAASAASGNSSQVKLKDGRVLKNPFIISRNPSGINVGHDSGVIFIKFAEMKPEIARKYGYNPQKAKAYEKDIEVKQRQRKAEKARRAEQKAEPETIYLDSLDWNSKEPSQLVLMREKVKQLRQQIARLENEKNKLAYTTVSNPRAPSGGYYYTYRGGYYRPAKKNTYTKQQSKNFFDKRRAAKEIDYEIRKARKRLNRVRNDIKRFYARSGKLKNPRY
ncbi:hypothetical protein P0136_00675 [Lentisphaerota bacterium ZTH]|nr:hypothetical protein JYG24_08180 [Lentisphaerota bacterium]WET06529.1 hypothetical protein P0136_00675 [Lentisphaerota bacterium ZTH]